MFALFICLDCQKEQVRSVPQNKTLTCKYCGSSNLKKQLTAPSSHSIIVVNGPQKTVEVMGNWEEIRNANKKHNNS